MLYSTRLFPLPVLICVFDVATELVLAIWNAWTMNVLLPPSPNSFSVALLLYTVNVAFPVPAYAVVA